MSAPATETSTPRPAAAGLVQPSAQEVDASCRGPLLLLFACSLVWLVVALFLAAFASVKSHAPGMFSDVAALTFGRLAGASSSSFYYGFASQAGIAIAIWLFARMGRTFMVLPRVSFVAAILWNLAVLIGVASIFAGEMTHYPAFEMPGGLFPAVFVAFALLGIAALLTFNARTEREIYPANWFLFAAIFVFPWIYTTAGMMLGDANVRPVLQPIISTWFFNNFLWLWLGSLALGTIFYFVSKLSGQPLHSQSLAAFGFWFYLFFATGSGFQNLPGVPNWMPALSRVLNILLLVPVLAFALNWHRTWRGRPRKQPLDPAAKYVVFSAGAFMASVGLLALLSCPLFDELLGFSIFLPGVIELANYGFIGMAFLGAMAHILPRLASVEWPKPALAAWHFRLTAAGVLLGVSALLIGGFVHGSAMNNPSVEFLSAVRRAVPFIGVNTIALLLIGVGQVLLLVNFGAMLRLCCAECCRWGSRKEVAQ